MGLYERRRVLPPFLFNVNRVFITRGMEILLVALIYGRTKGAINSTMARVEFIQLRGNNEKWMGVVIKYPLEFLLASLVCLHMVFCRLWTHM